MNVYPLKHYSIPQQIHGLLDDHAQRIQAAAIDMTDNLIVQAITQAAKEEGVTDLYLIDKKFAADAIKEKLEREDPNPLTIEELKGMIGEPVWVQGPGIPEYGRWAIVEDAVENSLILVNDFTCHDIGKTWEAYRHKPKEAK